MLTLRDRYIGTLLGVHIGDAIWTPFKGLPASDILPALERSGGLRFQHYHQLPNSHLRTRRPVGAPGPSSDQTADVCHSLLACHGFDSTHLRRSLQNSVVHGRSRLWRDRGSRTAGASRICRIMLGSDEDMRAEMFAKPIASNGSLRRAAPLALWLGPLLEGYSTPNGEAYQMMKVASELTHTHQDAVAACWLYVRMLRNALAGRDIADVKAHNKFDGRVLEYASRVELGEDVALEDPGSFANDCGGAEYTLKVALQALLTTDSFAACIRQVGLVGGDTDTYGAIAGGLAGAVYGPRGIPRQWQNSILGQAPMQQYAHELYDTFVERTGAFC